MSTESKLFYQTTIGYTWRKIFEVIGPILLDGNINFNQKTGVRIDGVTPKIGVRCQLDPSPMVSFTSWKEIGDISIGIDFQDLTKWLKTVNMGDIITFSTDRIGLESASPWLNFKHTNYRVIHEIKLPVLAIPQFTLENYENRHGCSVTLSAKRFDELVKSHGAGLPTLRFGVTACVRPNGRRKSYLHIRSEGRSPGQTIYPCGACGEGTAVGEVTCNRYDVKSLKNIIKCVALTTEVTIYIDGRPNTPLGLVYDIDEVGTIEFRLKAEEEEVKKDELEEGEIAPVPTKTGKTKVVTKRKAKKKKRKLTKVKDVEIVTKKKPAKKAKTSKLTEMKKKFKKAHPKPVVTDAQGCDVCGDYLLAGDDIKVDADGKSRHDLCAMVDDNEHDDDADDDATIVLEDPSICGDCDEVHLDIQEGECVVDITD